MTSPGGSFSRPPVRPLTEGYVVKGGRNQGASQIQTRPPAPAPIRTAPAQPASAPGSAAPAESPTGRNGR